MKLLNYIFIFSLLSSSFIYSQKSYNSIDTLLSKVFQSVNLRDSNLYVSRLNLKTYFINNKIKTKTDSIKTMLEITDNFKTLLDDFSDMTNNPETEIAFNSYDAIGSQNISLMKDGLIRLHVGILLNNQMIVKMPIVIMKRGTLFSLERPLVSMFLNEEKN